MAEGEEKEDPLVARKKAWDAYNTTVARLRKEYAEKQAALRATLDTKIDTAHKEYDKAIIELRTWFDDEMEKARRAHALTVS